MPEKITPILKTVQIQSSEAELRILPFVVAGLICFTIAVLLGSGSWYLFGSNKRRVVETVETPFPTPNENSPKTETSAETQLANYVGTTLTGVVKVPGSEITLGGGETKLPAKQVSVNDFFITETEVTNLQYAEFIEETNYRSPLDWKNGKFPEGKGNFPVTHVSYQDAEAFCQWMEKKVGLPVRLPTEAEWELAARGTEKNKYPWGDEWNAKNAASRETGGKVSAVKSFPLNRSPFGAFDMVGNVWEWTQERVGKNDVVTDEAVKEALAEGQVLRVVKGGSALSSSKELSVQARYEIPENKKVSVVGFRYVVEQKPNK